ncbi:MAG: peptide ABC transporter substrate-binding protein, partial [Pseudomonadota bacterium]
FPGVLELQEAITAMLLDVGLNVRLQWYEAAQKNRMQVKPFAEDRSAQIIVDQHDNNKGDAVFTVYSKYHSEGPQGKTTDPYLDFLIEEASSSTGDERTRLWQQVFSRIQDALIADAMLFHMVGYAAIGPKVSFEPTLETNSAVRLDEISFN